MKKRSVLFSSSLIYFFIILLFIGVRIGVQFIEIPVSDKMFDLIATLIIQIGIMFLFPVLFFSLSQKQKISTTFKDFNYNKLSFISLFICLFIGILCYFLNVSIASFFGSLIRIFGYESVPTSSVSSSSDYSLSTFFITVLSTALLPAICEETTHRGLLLKGFSSLGIKKAIILSSLLFGLMHLNINQFFYATILGFIIALSVIISKSILPAIIIHFVNNFLSVYFSFARANNWFGKGLYEFMTSFVSQENLFSYFISNFLMLAGLLMGIVLLFSLLLNNTRIKKVNNMLRDIDEINKEFNAGSAIYKNDSNFMNLQNLNELMKQYNIKNLNSMVFTDLESRTQKPKPIEVLLLVSCFVIGVLTTIFTFIWGIV